MHRNIYHLIVVYMTFLQLSECMWVNVYLFQFLYGSPIKMYCVQEVYITLHALLFLLIFLAEKSKCNERPQLDSQNDTEELKSIAITCKNFRGLRFAIFTSHVELCGILFCNPSLAGACNEIYLCLRNIFSYGVLQLCLQTHQNIWWAKFMKWNTEFEKGFSFRYQKRY